ncbi:MAG TPA: AarF/UbiB family protein [Bryobacteraceae bacterium]
MFRVLRILLVHAFRAGRAERGSGPERLRTLFENLGGTFLKFGQMLALQPDVIPVEYCTALFNLLDRVPPISFAEVERTFQQETGRPIDEAFDSVEREPLASASIGQVHVATLRGRKYAVKVQRPSAAFEFRCDVQILTAAMRWIRALRLRRLYWLIEPISEFVGWTEEELDYRNEARYMFKQRLNARNNPTERIPEVLAEFTTRRTLAAEFLEGQTVLSPLRAAEADQAAAKRDLEARGCRPGQVAANVIDNFLRDVFVHGMFHADLHPANLLILGGNAIGYIDFGITGAISRYSRKNLIALTLAYTRGDLAGMGQAFFRVSTTDKNFRPEKFRDGLKLLGKTWYASAGSSRRLRKNFTLVMLDMARLSRQVGIYPARDVVKYIRSAVAIDGLITRMAPEFDLGSHLQTTCDQYLKREMQRELLGSDALVDFVVSSLNLAGSGGRRAVGLLERMAAGSLFVSGAREFSGVTSGGPRRRALWLSALLLVLALTAAGEPAQFGWNVFTVQAGMLAATACLLLWTLRTLANES